MTPLDQLSDADLGTSAHLLLSDCLRHNRSPEAYRGVTLTVRIENRHAVLSPSSADRWFACPGSVAMCAGMASEERKGWSFTPDDEMIDAVEYACDYIRAIAADCGGKVYVDKWVEIDETGEGGTLDAAVVGRGVVHVIDYKHGKGKEVSAHRNKQMGLYLLGVVADILVPVKRGVLHIVQPRISRKPNAYEMNARAIAQFSKETKAAVMATREPNAKLAAGDHCFYCRAKGVCKEQGRHASDTLRQDFGIFSKGEAKPAKCDMFTLDELANVFRSLEVVDVFKKAVVERIMSALKAGKKCGDLKLVQGTTKRKLDETKAIATLRKMGFDLDDFMPRSLANLSDVEKLLGKKADKIMPKITTRSEPAPVIAYGSDDRPPFNETTHADFTRRKG